MDEDSFWASTPEGIAKHQASRLSADVALDVCCGVGGNTVQLAGTCAHVVGIDVVPEKLRMARHNAGVYGQQHKVDFVCGDAFQLTSYPLPRGEQGGGQAPDGPQGASALPRIELLPVSDASQAE